MGFDKILAPLAGKSVLQWSLDAFAATPGLETLVLVSPPGRAAEFERFRPEGALDFGVVEGGEQRTDSVRAGLNALRGKDSSRLVLVHDAARPLITPAAIRLCAEAAAAYGAAVLAEPVDDTLHRATEQGRIVESPARDGLWRAQTPQAATRAVLERALTSGDVFTDEASALRAAGQEVFIVKAPCPNFKMTRPPDLKLAEAILAARNSPP